jgi:hypothetical protein
MALDAATAGDTVLVASGNWSQFLSVTGKPLTLMSESGPVATTLTAVSWSNLVLDRIVADTFRLVGFGMAGLGVQAGVAVNYSLFAVENCRFLNVTGCAIWSSGGFGSIRGNSFLDRAPSHDGTSAIYVDNIGSVLIQRNVFYRVNYSSMFHTTGGLAVVLNNTFLDCNTGINLVGDASVSGIVYNNIFSGIAGTAILSDAKGPANDYNLFFQNGSNVSGTSLGPHSLFSAPLLTAPSAFNFRPSLFSPCIDVGHPDSIYNDPDGTRNDIGAVPFGVPIICDCACHADPQCDGITSDICDVRKMIWIAFEGVIASQGPFCPKEDSDVNCDGVSDVFDVIAVINVAFTGVDPATEYCDPCSH